MTGELMSGEDVAGIPSAGCGGEKHKYVFFMLASLALFMSSANATSVATALPAIQNGLRSDLNWTGWVITVYQLVNLTMMPIIGRVSDEWGRKRIFIGSVVIFTAGSLFCALSSNIHWLILSRFCQALGGGGILPSATGIVGDHFPESRAQAIGLFTSILPLGGIVGPALGGWLLDFVSWPVIFLINIPISLLVLVLTYFLLEPDSQVRRTRVDLGGAGLFAAFMLSIMFFLNRLGGSSPAASSSLTWSIPALGILLFLAFVRREKKAELPILDLAMLKNRTFAVINGLNLLYGACVLGIMAFIPYYAQVVYGFSNLVSGTMLTARALGMIAMSTATSMLLGRSGYRLPMAAGFFVLALSTLGLGLSPLIKDTRFLAIPDFWRVAVLVFVSGMGVGLASPPSNNAAIELMPEKIAAITGLRGMFRQTGGVIGTSLIVLVLSRFSDKTAGFQAVFLAMSALLVLAIPFIRAVPDGRQK